MKYEKEYYIQLTECIKNKEFREKTLENAKSTFNNLETGEERSSKFIEESEQLIKTEFVKDKRNEMNKILTQMINGYKVPVFDMGDDSMFKINISIESIKLYKKCENI